MKIKIILAVNIFSLLALNGYAQKDSGFWNSEILSIATASSTVEWINIKPDVILTPSSLFSQFKTALGLNVVDEMRLYKTEIDELSMMHQRFQQYNKGYKVFSGEFILHSRNNRLETANGNLVRGLQKNASVRITRQTALQKALTYFPATKYAWEIASLEHNKKLIFRDTTATYKPVAELVWVAPGEDDLKNGNSYVLAFMFDIYNALLRGKKIFINAQSGEVIKDFSLTPTCTATSATTNFYGSQGFSTRLIPGSNPPRHNLWNDCQAAFVRTLQWAANGTFTDYVSGASNNWSASTSAATSHWGVERAQDYFSSIHGRNGWNNGNAGVFILQDALFCDNSNPCNVTNPNNASFGGGTMMIGNGGNNNGIDDWNSLDIIAHEFGHGVTESSANLVYNREPGALNESFSDIFGVACHAWLFGLNLNTWKVGFDRKNPLNTAQSLYIRNMANPNDLDDPDTYLDTDFWVPTTGPDPGDSWGVHTNSGVQNYMFYLLVGGGAGTNDNGNPFSVLGIGIVAARHIAYRVLNFYLTSSSKYSDARTAWVRAATDEYGVCSFQAIETGKAWDAVGLPPPISIQTTPYCGTYGGSVFSVTSPSIYSLSLNCNMTVSPASLVQFGANKVILNPGFKAQNGSHFRAYVSDCRYAAY